MLLCVLVTAFCIPPVASVLYSEEGTKSYRDHFCASASVGVPAGTMLHALQVDEDTLCPPNSEVITNSHVSSTLSKSRQSSGSSSVEVSAGTWCLVSVAGNHVNLAKLGYPGGDSAFFSELITVDDCPSAEEGEEENPWGPHPYEQDNNGYCPESYELYKGLCYPVSSFGVPGCQYPLTKATSGDGCINTVDGPFVPPSSGCLPDEKWMNGECYIENGSVRTDAERCTANGGVWKSINGENKCVKPGQGGSKGYCESGAPAIDGSCGTTTETVKTAAQRASECQTKGGTLLSDGDCSIPNTDNYDSCKDGVLVGQNCVDTKNLLLTGKVTEEALEALIKALDAEICPTLDPPQNPGCLLLSTTGPQPSSVCKGHIGQTPGAICVNTGYGDWKENDGCPPGYTIISDDDKLSDKCFRNLNQCPIGYEYDLGKMVCTKTSTPICDLGGDRNPTTGVCEFDPTIETCPAGSDSDGQGGCKSTSNVPPTKCGSNQEKDENEKCHDKVTLGGECPSGEEKLDNGKCGVYSSDADPDPCPPIAGKDYELVGTVCVPIESKTCDDNQELVDGECKPTSGGFPGITPPPVSLYGASAVMATSSDASLGFGSVSALDEDEDDNELITDLVGDDLTDDDLTDDELTDDDLTDDDLTDGGVVFQPLILPLVLSLLAPLIA
ncbi:MAG: hypothetical protein LBV40_01295 [Methanomicrobiales archaeon]|nr:hypothetical protein [Methanomicrobiales archaeon]